LETVIQILLKNISNWLAWR